MLEVIRGYCPDEPKSKDLREYWEKRYEPLIKVREKVEKIPLSDRWIPVSERLPEERDAGVLKKLGTDKRSDYVIATVEVKGERMTVTACTYDGKWYWRMKNAFLEYKVIAWCPLPEPWEGEEK